MISKKAVLASSVLLFSFAAGSSAQDRAPELGYVGFNQLPKADGFVAPAAAPAAAGHDRPDLEIRATPVKSDLLPRADYLPGGDDWRVHPNYSAAVLDASGTQVLIDPFICDESIDACEFRVPFAFNQFQVDYKRKLVSFQGVAVATIESAGGENRVNWINGYLPDSKLERRQDGVHIVIYLRKK